MQLSKVMMEVVNSILRRVLPFERRRWMYDDNMFKLWKVIDRLPMDSAHLRSSACRIALGLMYHQVEKEKQAQAVEEICILIPFMQAWLRSYHIAGFESRAVAEKRRKQAEKDWKDGKREPSPDF